MIKINYLPIDSLKGAEYNPRIISDEQFRILVKSIKEIGFVLPVIVNSRNNTLIAGHQRTKAACEAGLKEIPCFLCDGLVDGDEIRFNQLHNFTDTHDCKAYANIDKLGYQQLSSSSFNLSDNNATQLQEICKLMTKYGNLLCAVVCDGNVLVGARYIKACQLLRSQVNVFNIDPKFYQKAAIYLSSDYGVYNYDNLAKNTFVQGLAQMHRTVEQTNKKQNKSNLYTKLVLPFLQNKPELSVLDFGCGKGAYINSLAKSGRLAIGVEFYNNNGKSIDIKKGNNQVDKLITTVKSNGLFDVVVCDSVLNSVDSMKAEQSVLRCLSIFSKGKIFLSGRTLSSALCKAKLKRRMALSHNLNYFFDENNFTGTYRKGNWYYQHYHSEETIKKAVEDAGLKIDKIIWGSTSFQVECSKFRELSFEEKQEAINFEFTLPLPNGRRYNRNNEILSLLFPEIKSE